MKPEIQKFIAPFLPCPVVFDTPKRMSFSIKRFSGFKQALSLLIYHRRERSMIQAEHAYNDAIKAHSIGGFAQAEKLYNRCIDLYPDHEPAYTNLAALYLERNSEDLAIEELKNGLKARPHFYRGYYNLGLIYNMQQKYDDAIAMFEQALNYNKDHIWSLIALAEIHVHVNDLTKAIEYYSQALSLVESPLSVYMRLGELYLIQRDYQQSEALLRRALEVKPLPEIYYNLGWLLACQNKEPEEMVNMFLMANKTKKDFKEALFNLALAQSVAGYYEQSVKNMTRYVKYYERKGSNDLLKRINFLRRVAPDNHEASMKAADLYMESSQVQKAIEALAEVVEKAPEFVPALQKLAELYHQLGRHKEAMKSYRNLIELAPKNVAGYLGLTRAYGDIENYAAAVPVIRKVLELAPHNTEIHYQYATLMAQEGELGLALKHYKIVAHQDPAYPRINKRLRMIEEEFDETAQDNRTPFPVLKRKSSF